MTEKQLIHLGKGDYIGLYTKLSLMVGWICALDINEIRCTNTLRVLCSSLHVSGMLSNPTIERHTLFRFAFFKEDPNLPLSPIRKALGENSHFFYLHHVIGLGSTVAVPTRTTRLKCEADKFPECPQKKGQQSNSGLLCKN